MKDVFRGVIGFPFVPRRAVLNLAVLDLRGRKRVLDSPGADSGEVELQPGPVHLVSVCKKSCEERKVTTFLSVSLSLLWPLGLDCRASSNLSAK